MKIKTKKQLNLPQLIEWGFKNDISGRFCSDDKELVKVVDFVKGGLMNIEGWIFNNDTFTVTVEEEITEDTVIPKMLEMYRDATSNLGAYIHINQSINSVIEDAEVLTLHIINDDGTHTLIWRNGKLVE